MLTQDMKGDKNMQKFGCFGGLDITQGHRQHNHLLEHIRLSIRL